MTLLIPERAVAECEPGLLRVGVAFKDKWKILNEYGFPRVGVVDEETDLRPRFRPDGAE
ncbi:MULTISPECIES: hypothetical protein [unclassified Chelatococcus]|uniref:hypothetical protein n=1 Tax=unclassified Chelatococcus TaxID=2638111 RepID=UPI0020BE5DAC|nr:MULTISPECIES: hypothetical protein [unclassified Chelatococcus]